MLFEKMIEQGKKSKYYQDFKTIEDEINHYRNHIQPMTNEQGNTFRHRAGSAAMAQLYNPVLVNGLGVGKEFEDYFLENKSGWDSWRDLGNNLYGSIVGSFNKETPRRSLYDMIFEGIK